MQPRPVHMLQAELHGASGAKERRHPDDSPFHNLMFIRHRRFEAWMMSILTRN